jgi:hypothetical protein
MFLTVGARLPEAPAVYRTTGALTITYKSVTDSKVALTASLYEAAPRRSLCPVLSSQLRGSFATISRYLK